MSGRVIDLTGKDFGYLHVIRRSWRNDGPQVEWLCQCKNCGRYCVVEGRYLKSGEVKSCGCMKRGKSPGVMSYRRLQAASESLSRLEKDIQDPYQDLANAIICVAADDYRHALRAKDPALQKEIESFFTSDWYETLTNMDPDKLMELLHKENDGQVAVVFM